MKKKIKYIFVITIFICVLLTINVFAITEADVQSVVDAKGKEAVSGNILVWFLCAIGFMKVSQKIDSFMGTLGISVGKTGGSMMAEAMIIGRTISSVFKSGGKFAGFGRGGGNGQVTPMGAKGSFFGGIGRKMANGAAGSVTGNGQGTSTIMGSIGKKMYQNSMNKGGSFATSVISSVARGDINKMGTISGENGKAAMESYFGYNANASVDKKEGFSGNMNINQNGHTTDTINTNVNGNIGFTPNGQAPEMDPNLSGVSTVPGGESSGSDNGDFFTEKGSYEGSPYINNSENYIPTFSDIEMGGGRITGIEQSGTHPDGIQFAMYDAEKYAKPDGHFETVTAIDNSVWYKQYAEPTVERTPYMSEGGKVKYNEKIVDKIPMPPMRKDQM